MKNRNGYTLIEVVMAMTVGFILLGTGVRLLILTVRLDRASRTRLADDSSLDRLSRSFRDDVASAGGPPPGAERDVSRLELSRPSGSVARYFVENDSLVRVVLERDKPVRRESYSMPKHCEPRFELANRGGIHWVCLRWKRKPGPSDTPSAEPVPLEAALNRFSRLEAREGDGNAK